MGRHEIAVRDEAWSHGVQPYLPLSTLKAVADGVWIVDGPVIQMRVGPLGLPLPTRMVVVRLASGELWLWSPTAPTPALFAELDAIGTVAHLVSPNRMHYAGIPAWQAQYPAATAWASPGVRERARGQGIDVRWGADLDDAAPAAWAADLEQIVFRGNRFMEEVVFLHRGSRTLIVADLVIALDRQRVRAPWRWLFAMVGVVGGGRTPRELSVMFWGRRARARGCYQQVRDWAPARVIVAHGQCYLDDAPARLDRAFAWLR
jgi:hypothetical protein